MTSNFQVSKLEKGQQVESQVLASFTFCVFPGMDSEAEMEVKHQVREGGKLARVG